MTIDRPPSREAGSDDWLCECDHEAHGILGCRRAAVTDRIECAECTAGQHEED